MIKSVVLSISLFMSIAYAEETPLRPLQQEHQKLFEKQKALEEVSHNERIRILQEADSCVKGAKTPSDYRACEKKEQDARQQLKEKQKPEQEALKHEREMLKEKALKQREERKKDREYPRGKIETH